MPLDLFSEEITPQRKPLDLFPAEAAKPKPGRYDWLTRGEHTISPAVQRMQTEGGKETKQLLKGTGRGFQTMGYGLLRGTQSFWKFFDDAATLVSRATGFDKGGIFEALTEAGEPPAHWAPKDLAERVVSGIAAAGPEIAKIATFGRFLPGGVTTSMATIGAVHGGAEGGLKRAAYEATKGALLGQVLKGAAQIPKPFHAPTVGGIFAGQAAVEGGGPEEIAEAGAVGVGLGLLGGKERIKRKRPALSKKVIKSLDKTEQKIFAKDVKQHGPEVAVSSIMEHRFRNAEMLIGSYLKKGDTKKAQTVYDKTVADINKLTTIDGPLVDMAANWGIDVFDKMPAVQKLKGMQEIKPEIPTEKPVVSKPETGKAQTIYSYGGKEIDKLPKYAGSINLERQNIPKTAKEIELKLSEKIPKSTQTWIETQKEAAKIIGNQRQFQTLIKKAAKGQGVTAQEIDALRQVEVNAVSQLAKITASPEREALLKEFQEGIFQATSKAATSAGRALNIHKRVTAPNQLASALTKLQRKLTDKEWNRFNEANKAFVKGNPKPLFEFADYIEATKENPKIKDYIYEYWYNSILSGVPTHLVNTGSNTLWQLFQGTVHRPLLTAIDPIMARLQGRQREYFVSEIIPMWAGMAKGFKRGAKAAGEVIRKGYTLEEGATKWDIETSQVMGAWERSPYPIVRKLAPFVTAFSRGLRAMDVWAKAIAFDGQIEALATRKAVQQGLMGSRLLQTAEEYAKAPTDLMIEEASKYADYATFMDAPGEATQKLLNLRRVIPGGRLIIPFVNTIANLLKRGAEMTPGMGLAIKGGREAIKKGGPELTEVIVKQIEGVMIAGVIANIYADERITGATPHDKAEREAFYRAGKQPWSIKVGDKWYSYRRVEPFNTVIGSVAILMDEWNDSKEEPTTEKIVGVGTGIAQNLLDGSYLQGLNGLMEAIKSGETNPQRLINIVERTAASFVPYSSFQRSLVRAEESAETGKTILRTPENFIDVLKAQTPGLSKEVRSRKNIWGESIELEGGPVRQFLPWKVQTESPDPVDKEIYRLAKAGFMPFPGMPSKKVEGIELTPEQYDKYLKFFGQTAKKVLDMLVKSPLYEKASDKSKAKLITSILRKSRQGQRFIKLFLMKDNEKQRRKIIDLFGGEINE